MAPRRVLAIDDDFQVLRIIELGLAELGHLVVLRASNGRAGATMAAADPPDLILLDCDMPTMDGLDTLRLLRASERTVRTLIVAMTGSWLSTSRCAEMMAGCNTFLVKPFTLKTLRDTVLSFLPAGGDT